MNSAADDEDTTAARPVTRSSSRGHPAANPIGSTLHWGLVGNLHRVEPLTAVPGQSGIVRLVSNTVQYTKPPLGVSWYPVKQEPGRFEMSWPDDPTAVRTLAQLGSDCRQHAHQQPLSEEHSLAKELDAAIFALLHQAEKLKRAGWGVGLLTPGGVMLQNNNGALETVLVDLGFTWKGDFGDPPWDASPGKPSWLMQDELDNPACQVWDLEAIQQQFAMPSGHPFAPAKTGHEVRTLARVIAWTLTGRPSRTLPWGHHAPVWPVLEKALSGAIETPLDLLTELKEYRPSTHFFAEPKPIQVLTPLEPEPKNRWLPMLLVIGTIIPVLAALIALMAFQKSTSPTTATPLSTTSPTVDSPPTDSPPTSTTPPEVAKKDGKSLLDQLKWLRESLKASPQSAELQTAREKLFADWVQECERLTLDGAEASRRSLAGQSLRDLVDQYDKIHSEYPPLTPAAREQENQWLEQYNRQAELLGWPR